MNDEQWGIFDVKDSCWIGNDDGPRLYDDHMLARIAAQVSECQFYGTDLGCRHEARVYPGGPMRLRDQVEAKLTPVAALRRIEGADDADEKPSKPIELTVNPVGDWVRPANE